jgi:hypothetical protein
MGLKGYRSWVMGQLDSNVQSPTTYTHARGLHPKALHCANKPSGAGFTAG